MASEVERIGEECRRYSERMVARMAEAKAQREARSREQAERAAAEMQQLRQELVERAIGQEDRQDDRPVRVGGQGRQGDELLSSAGRQTGVEAFQLQEAEVQRLRREALRIREKTVAPSEADGVPVQQSDVTGCPADPAQTGDLDPRKAIARAAAARRRNSVVAPIDDDGDDEAEYYRRGSWLV
ncbi:hypothetical protein HGA13_14725 [Nocardia speluncae]|uniref:Uncharacterized protein n=1 Tax=Nocardia speluncae TaxID=419477 RepID=A0A846XEF0_9NOCA|nr:hypothetical protein [Nocardia speluncae]NKY34322.1 hypothetical protein [Nocardia speluncae]